MRVPQALRRWVWRLGLSLAALVVAVLGLALLAGLALGPSGMISTWTRVADRPEVVELSGLRLLASPALIGQPRWSPDGKTIAYVQFQKQPRAVSPDEAPSEEDRYDAYLMVVPAEGGEPRRVTQLEGPQPEFGGNGFTWTRDSHSVLVAKEKEAAPVTGRGAQRAAPRIELRSISLETGTAADLITLTRGAGAHDPIPWSPDLALSPAETEVAISLSEHSSSGWRTNIGVVDLASRRLRPMPPLYDSAQREVAVSDSLAWRDDRIYFTCLVPQRPGAMPRQEIWSIRADGADRRQETAGPDDGFAAPRPGGHDLALIRDDSICLRRADGRVTTLVRAQHCGLKRGRCEGPISWSPDGKRIAFAWIGQRSGAPSLWTGQVRDALPAPAGGPRDR
jgi:hypothetical protein